MTQPQTEFDLQQFEDACQQNGIRYWWAHEFMRTLGYPAWAAFEPVIHKAMASCSRLNIDPTEVFIRDSFLENGRQIKTFKLTRFACFLVTVHADSRKPQVSQAKAALAAIADRLIADRIGEGDLGRIETREDIKLVEKVMSQAAQSAGLQNTQFGIFKDAGFRGMYNMSLRDLMAHKGVGSDKTLYDFMGLEELAGNLFRVTQTAARIKSQRVSGLPALVDTAKTVGREVRDMMIRNSGSTPESLPIEEDISKVKRRIKSARKAMEKLDAPEKAGAKRLPKPTLD
jgi:DNA-damage-inducible protein D